MSESFSADHEPDRVSPHAWHRIAFPLLLTVFRPSSIPAEYFFQFSHGIGIETPTSTSLTAWAAELYRCALTFSAGSGNHCRLANSSRNLSASIRFCARRNSGRKAMALACELSKESASGAKTSSDGRPRAGLCRTVHQHVERRLLLRNLALNVGLSFQQFCCVGLCKKDIRLCRYASLISAPADLHKLVEQFGVATIHVELCVTIRQARVGRRARA